MTESHKDSPYVRNSKLSIPPKFFVVKRLKVTSPVTLNRQKAVSQGTALTTEFRAELQRTITDDWEILDERRFSGTRSRETHTSCLLSGRTSGINLAS